MKKINILLIILTLIFTSCSKDDDSILNDTSADIVGIWETTDYDYTGSTTTTAQGQSVSIDFTGEAYDIDYKLTFEENPNNLTAAGSLKLKVIETTTGKTLSDSNENLSVLEKGTWEIVGKNLIINRDGEVNEMKIEELTKSSLVLSIEEEIDLSQSGVSIISTIKAIISFER